MPQTLSPTISTNNGSGLAQTRQQEVAHDVPWDNEHGTSAGEIPPTINTNNGNRLAPTRQQQVTHDVPWDNEHGTSTGKTSSSGHIAKEQALLIPKQQACTFRSNSESYSAGTTQLVPITKQDIA